MEIRVTCFHFSLVSDPNNLFATMSSILLRPRTAHAFTKASRRLFSTKEYQHIIASRPVPSVALLTLNRPKALNALSTPLFRDLNAALLEADAEKEIGAIVITGSEKAFAGELFWILCRSSSPIDGVPSVLQPARTSKNSRRRTVCLEYDAILIFCQTEYQTLVQLLERTMAIFSQNGPSSQRSGSP